MVKLLRRFTYLILLGIVICSVTIACHSSHVDRSRDLFQPISNCRIVQHSMGETCVAKTLQRVVALNPAALGNTIALGVKPIASVYDYADRFPSYLQDQVEGVTSLGIGTSPSIEKLTLLKPDVMVGWKHHHQGIYSQLSTLAPTIFYDWIGGNVSDENWKQYFNFIAKTLNREQAAEQVWQHYDQRVAELKAKLGDTYKGKTISFIFFCCGGILSERSFAGSVLNDVGLKRPLSQSDPSGSTSGFTFSEERLDLIDGDVMFVAIYGGRETGERDLKRLQKSPLWSKLSVVQRNRVYYIDPDIWRGRTPIAAELILDDLEKYLVEGKVGSGE